MCTTFSLETVDTGGGLRQEVQDRDRKLELNNMERGLHERDRVGVQDFVLLEDFQSESAFIDNLHKRFNEDLIYVSGKHNYSVHNSS